MNRSEEKISVIVPIYNQEQYLERCLQSLNAQTYENISFILVDDGSTDKSAEICKHFCERDNRFKYVYQKNSGVSAARNNGLKLADGDYIGFCDSDDWAEPDLYEFLYTLLKQSDADVAICGFEFQNDLNNQRTTPVVMDIPQAICSMYSHGYRCGGYLWNKLIKREKIGSIVFDEKYAIYEDMVFMCEVYCRCQRVIYQNEQKYHYNFNLSSALHGKFRESEWSGQDAQKKLITIVSQNFPEILCVAQKGVLLLSLRLADRLLFSKELTKTNYRRLKTDIKDCFTRESISLITKKRRFTLKLFMKSRILYIFIRKCIRLFCGY